MSDGRQEAMQNMVCWYSEVCK